MIFQSVAAQLFFHYFLQSSFRIVAARVSLLEASDRCALLECLAPSRSIRQCRMRVILQTSMGSPPISPAKQTSPIRSPTWATTMPPPSIQWWTSSNSSFVNPSSPRSEVFEMVGDRPTPSSTEILRARCHASEPPSNRQTTEAVTWRYLH